MIRVLRKPKQRMKNKEKCENRSVSPFEETERFSYGHKKPDEEIPIRFLDSIAKVN